MHRKSALQLPMMMMLGKEQLSGLWVCPECRSYCCHFHLRSCFTFPFHPFFSFLTTSLRPGVVGVCFEVPGCNVMPERLLFVISGILAGGIPGFRMELCCFSHPPTWPIGVFCGSSVLLLVLGHSQWHIRCHFACNSHCWWRSHFSVSFLFWFCCGCVFFACFCFVVFGLLSCLFSCWDSFWTAYWSTTSTFVAFDKLTALHVNYNSTVCRDWMCVTTWRKPWRRWTEKKALVCFGLLFAAPLPCPFVVFFGVFVWCLVWSSLFFRLFFV